MFYRERIGKIGLFLCRICAIVIPAMILSAAIRKPRLLITILMRVRLTNLGALVRRDVTGEYDSGAPRLPLSDCRASLLAVLIQLPQ
jgi:hypothetical protein